MAAEMERHRTRTAELESECQVLESRTEALAVECEALQDALNDANRVNRSGEPRRSTASGVISLSGVQQHTSERIPFGGNERGTAAGSVEPISLV